MEKNSPILEFRSITKRFGELLANNAVSLRVQKGSIHAIVGENGAGKSTAMKILYGQYFPNEGEIYLRGMPVRWRSPKDAIRNGIGMVHQHFMLAGTHTILENILVGINTFIFEPYNREGARKKLLELAHLYGLQVDPDAFVDQLSVGIRQRVEILKLLFAEAQIIILDEPTAVLTPQETQTLFHNLRRLKLEGKTILIITHKLKEVLEISDKVTVLRGGRVVAEKETKATNINELAELMVGGKIEIGKPWPVPCQPKENALVAKNLAGALKNLSLSVRSGEIVGIAGVEGNGQSELLRALLFPKENIRSGTLKLFGEDITKSDPEKIRALGVGVLAEDRQRESLLLNFDLQENFLLGHQRDSKLQHRGILRKEKIARLASIMMKDYDVRPRLLSARMHELSGGNQQKFVVGRELFRHPRLLIAAHPTRGVDIGSQEFIHRRIFESRDRGAAVLLFSSDLEEVLRLSDRILVMFRGEIIAEHLRGAISETEIGIAMGGVRRSA